MKSKKCGFTLIELLVVIAIIAILAGMLLPALARSKDKAWGAKCLNNFKQVGIASVMYGNEFEDSLPMSSHQSASWVDVLRPYLSGTNLWRCPRDLNRDRPFSFAINDFLLPPSLTSTRQNFSKTSMIPGPAETVFMAETRTNYATSDHFHLATPWETSARLQAFRDQVDTVRHRGIANYLFTDGHVDGLSWVAVLPRLTRAESRFIKPSGQSELQN